MRDADLLVFQHQHAHVFYRNRFVWPVFHAFDMAVTNNHLPVAEFEQAGRFDADGSFDHDDLLTVKS